MKSEPNITRCDYGRTHGWWVRIYRTDGEGDKNCMSQMFSDAVHGGKRKALLKVRAWRDEMQAILPAKKEAGVRKPIGYGYVKRVEIKRRVGFAPVFVAWVKTATGPRSTSRSIAEWGVAGAKRECEKWLREARKQAGHENERTEK